MYLQDLDLVAIQCIEKENTKAPLVFFADHHEKMAACWRRHAADDRYSPALSCHRPEVQNGAAV